MSFTEQVKNELARIPREDAGSRAAELLALLRMSGSFITGAHASWGLEFSTGNSAVARRVLVYLKKDFGFMPSTMVRQGRRLRKKNVYTLLVQPSKEGLHFLDTMGLSPLSGAEDMEKLVTAEERRAYLAGAFLGGGSVSRPQSDYHLEMVTQSARFAEEIVKAMKSFRLNARLTDRRRTPRLPGWRLPGRRLRQPSPKRLPPRDGDAVRPLRRRDRESHEELQTECPPDRPQE